MSMQKCVMWLMEVNDMLSERKTYVDWGKCLGIYFIIIGHFLPAGNVLRIVLYSFHVPLFMIISGALYSNKKWGDGYLIHLFKRVMVPYFVWFIVSAAPFLIVGKMSILVALKKITFIDGTMIWNTALWFLPCYFMAVVVYSWISSLLQNNRIGLIVMTMFIFAIAIIMDMFEVKKCFLGLNKVILLLGFFSSGKLLKNCVEKQVVKNKKMVLILSIILFGFFAFISAYINFGNNISILNGDYNNHLFIYIIIALVMCLTFMNCCNVFPPHTFVQIVSKNSLFIMCSHLFFRLMFEQIYVSKGWEFGLGIGVGICLLYTLAMYFFVKVCAVKCKLNINILNAIGIQI